MSQSTQDEVRSAIVEVLCRSSVDPQFRQLALSKPLEALKAASSTPPPSGFQIRFVESKPGYQTIVLPDRLDNVTELSEEELEQVAGGMSDPTATAGIKISW